MLSDLERFGWVLAVALALWAGFEGGRTHAQPVAETFDCLTVCEADDDDGDPALCPDLCEEAALANSEPHEE